MIAEEGLLDSFQKSDFKMIKRLGKGCQGQVFQIQHRLTNKHFAMKAIYIHPSISEKQKRRIECQIQSNLGISSHLQSINFAKMHHHWVEPDSINILFELCQQNGEEGFKKLKKYSQRYNYLFVMMFDILSALSLLQQLNIIHRDIKSQNILLKESIFKLGDLGLSRFYEKGNSFTNDIGNRLGRSPEFITGNYSFKADIWSLGIHIFYMLQNSLPFDQQSLIKIKTDPNKIESIISSSQLQINLICSSRQSKNSLSYLHLIMSEMIVIDASCRSSSLQLLHQYFDRNIMLENCNLPKIALFGYLHERPAFSQYYLIILLSFLDYHRFEGKIKPHDTNKNKINLKVQLTLLQILRFTRSKLLRHQQKAEKVMDIYDYLIVGWQGQLLKEFPQKEVMYDIEGIEQTLQIFKISRLQQKFVLLEWIMKLVKSVQHLRRGMQCYRIPIWQIPLQISKIL